jgi:hypothetical protein
VDDTCDDEISFFLRANDKPVMDNGVKSSFPSSIFIKPETYEHITCTPKQGAGAAQSV